MTRFPHSLIFLLAIASGCTGKTYSVVNPVLGPPPPRVATTQTRTADISQGSVRSDIHQVSHTTRSPLPTTFVVARVNGYPILAGEILEPFHMNLKQQEAKIQEGIRAYERNPRSGLSPEKGDEIIRDTQEQIISRQLDDLIDLQIMSQTVRNKLKKEQLESIQTQLDEMFQKDVVEGLKLKTGANNMIELETQLQERGTSLESMRKLYTLQAFKEQYQSAKLGNPPRPSRAEILARYNKDRETYLVPEKVKWQQLQVSFKSGQSKSVAEQKIEEAQAELQAGLSFDDAVKKFSDGAFKQNGGYWDWTQPESIASPEVRNALNGMRPGQYSSILSTVTGFQMVRLVERVEKSYRPFDEVQNDIRMQIIKEWTEAQQARVSSELRDNAVIEIYLDLPNVES